MQSFQSIPILDTARIIVYMQVDYSIPQEFVIRVYLIKRAFLFLAELYVASGLIVSADYLVTSRLANGIVEGTKE